jgi:tripartite-type tricarboxylate transporter receptor subunit TctC
MKEIRMSIARRIHGALGALTVPVVLAAMSLAPAAADAQAYPSGTVRIVVPFQPGGLTDIAARTIAPHLAKHFGQPFVVENRPGASGNIAAELVARAQPDGQTLLMGSIGTNAVNAHLFSKMPYDTLKDFEPVSQVVSGTLLLVVHPSVPANTLGELLALARAKPGTLAYASGGVGASQHLAGELLKTMAKVDILHVPYKGIAPGIVDLLGGQVSMTFDMASVMPHIQAGRLRALATAGASRSSTLPDVPTIAESGVPGYEASAWYGLFAPAGTPKEIVASLQREVAIALREPQTREKLLALGAEPVGSTPTEFATFVRNEYDKWGKVVKSANIRMD